MNLDWDAILPWLNLVIGSALISGAVVAYAHQSWLIVRKGGASVSALSLTLNSMSSWFMFLNLLVLKGSQWFKAQQVTLAHVLAFVQVFSGFACSLVVLVLLWGGRTKAGRLAFAYSMSKLCVEAVSGGIIAYIYFWQNEYAFRTAEIYGIISIGLELLTWMPQIVLLLWKLDPTSLSLLLVLAEVSGSLLSWLYQSVLNHEHWSTWASNIAILLQQIIILILWVSLSIWRCCKKRKAEEEEEETIPMEKMGGHPNDTDFIDFDAITGIGNLPGHMWVDDDDDEDDDDDDF